MYIHINIIELCCLGYGFHPTEAGLIPQRQSCVVYKVEVAAFAGDVGGDEWIGEFGVSRPV